MKQFLTPFEIISFDSKAATIYADIRFFLAKRGNIIGPNDLILAATVLANNGSLVTKNQGEFRRLESLSLLNW